MLAGAESFDKLALAFDSATAGGHLDAVTESSQAEVGRTRIRTAYHYLLLLGYLDQLPPETLSSEGVKAKQWRRTLRAGIELFQAEAGLCISGVLDDLSWRALLELCGFETSTHIRRWFKDGQALPILKRAAQVRLYAFGLCSRLPRTENLAAGKTREQEKNFCDAMQGFVRAADLFRLSNTALTPSLQPQTLACLFGQDRIIDCLSRGGERIHIYQPAGASNKQKKKDRAFASEFVRHAAKIELWLFGYNVSIGSGKDKVHIQNVTGTLSLDAALREFLTLHGGDPRFNKVDKGSVPGFFFGKLLALRKLDSDPEDVADADIVVNQVINNNRVAAEVRNGIRSFASRLWDGTNRVWRWFKHGIKNLFARGLRVLKTAISNITRYVYESARRIYQRTVAAVHAVVDGLTLLKQDVVRGSDINHLYISHDKDFDFDVYVNPQADADIVTNLSDRLLLRAGIFHVAAKIISTLLGFFVDTVRRGITSGWFGLVLSLVNLRKTLNDLRRYSQQELELMAQLDVLFLSKSSPAIDNL